MTSLRALFINGTVGVGKSTVAEAVSDLLAKANIANALIDVDSLRRAWPCPPGDRFNTGLALRNLACVSANYVDAGAAKLILAGVIESPLERKAHEDALGMTTVICRLRGDLSVIRDRLTRRHGEDKEALEWHLHRAPELDAVLDSAGVDDFAIDVTTATPPEIALEVARAVEWIAPW